MLIDETGNTYGRWLVLRKGAASEGKAKMARWVCLCTCGNEGLIVGATLRNGESTSCGCFRSELRTKEVVGYQGMHSRVHRANGPAKDYMCPCGKPAREWAYDHEDPEEIWGMPNRGCKEAVYSLKVEHYIPMCCSCHERLDAPYMDRVRNERGQFVKAA